ncbi:polysaccharide deacetylase family protein [Virgibacillus soli]|uniref:Polysaccharide deacetylase family protein n=1 Tax=Paracerasibacillus soli TaxID=480284 RepID=A0ABU5CPB8_9BACI|nr:polysaccharide deacetylase family protein [Virgibacillus soli]MDY0408199.1 polysaccharide deacetylase family protein [Virgibacillus soli]
MKRYQGIIHLIVFVFIVALVWDMQYNPFTVHDFQSGSFVEVVNAEDPLFKEIKNKSDQYKEEPTDAYIDRVWKKTPGRNGRKVNINKSYELMKGSGNFDEKKLVFDQVNPETSLEDLPAAPIYRGHPDKDMVAFLINVSWGTEHIPTILKTLKANEVKATFFIEGKWAKENVEYVKMIAEEGHSLGNHAYNHPDMAHLNNEEIEKQIVQTNEIIKAITGETPKWFAPPSGSFTDQVVKVAHEHQMQTILWTVDTIDWKKPSVSVMMNRVMNKVHPGATILMHPTPPVAQGMDQMIKEILRKGYKIGTIDKLLSEER